ncbi:hypothetical protein ACUOFC_39935, partial [Escherichia sp. TWPC-MK]
WRVLYFLLLLAQVVLLCWQPWLWLNGESVTGVSRNIAIQHVNATDRALIAVNHHRHDVVS